METDRSMTATVEIAGRTESRFSGNAQDAIFIDPLQDGPLWDWLVMAHPGAGFFHHGEWARVLCRTYGHRPAYLAVFQGDQLAALIGLMEVRSLLTGRRGVSVPFADFGAPLLAEGADPAAVMDVLRNVARGRRWKYLELRGGGAPEVSAPASQSYHAHCLDLTPGPEALFAHFDSSVRRAIRKAERAGLAVEIRTDWQAMAKFYQMHARTRRRHGLPPQPKAFFVHIHEEIIKAGRGAVALVSHEGRPVAGAVFFYRNRKAVYKFGACDERHQETRANNLAMWAGIQYLAEHGCETLHFGRTDRGHEGLRRYKLGWGAAESVLNYFKLDLRSDSWVVEKNSAPAFHTAVFSRMPLLMNRLFGRFIYPHLA
jgi:hypothetical protein